MSIDPERAFATAGLVINRAQAQALADLMWEGKQTGTSTATDLPLSLALGAVGPRESLGETFAANRDGSHRVEGDLVAMEPDPSCHTLLVVAEDGRAWQIVRAGIAWPVLGPGGDQC